MKHKTSNHVELENTQKPSTVVVNTKDYSTVVVRVLDENENLIHTLEVEDWDNDTELEVIRSND